jgi:hypothetical protein
MTAQSDDKMPPLQENNEKIQPAPLPWFQLSIVLFLELEEPLTLQVIYPLHHSYVLSCVCSSRYQNDGPH